MSQNISGSATSNLSPNQNQMSMQARLQSQDSMRPVSQQPGVPSWSSSYYGQSMQSPYSNVMNPYMPHGSSAGVPNHTSAMSQSPLQMGQKPTANSSDRSRTAYPPPSNLYTQPPPPTGSAASSYYGYDPYYNQVPADPYLSHPGSAGAAHWPPSTNQMVPSGSAPSSSIQPLRPQTGSSGPGMIPQAQNTASSIPALASRPPPPSQTPERNTAPQHSSSADQMMSSFDRQRGSTMSQQPQQHPSAIMSQGISGPATSNLSPNQNQMSMPARLQSQDPVRPIAQQTAAMTNWSSSYYGQSSQSPYSGVMNPYMSHGSGSVTNHNSAMSQPTMPAMGQKPSANGSERARAAYPPASNLYSQPPAGGAAGYYGYDPCYGQVPTDPYLSHSSSANMSHWSSSAPGGSILSNSATAPGGPHHPRLPAGGASVLPQSQPTSTSLPPLGSRPPPPSQTPERSPAQQLAPSYPSPNQQGTTKPVSNSLAQLEQMVMPNSSQGASAAMKSPTQRSTTNSPSANPQQMQYSYNSSGQGSYFSSGSNQPSYYPPYDTSSVSETPKTAWPEQQSSSLMNLPPGPGMIDSNVGPYGQPSYDNSSSYGEYTQLSTPRFQPPSEMPTDPHQAEKSDPYAIDSQTFDDHDEQSTTSKAKKSRAKKGDDSAKKERKQRAPRVPKGSVSTVQPQSPSANSTLSIAQPKISPQLTARTPDIMPVAPESMESTIVQPPMLAEETFEPPSQHHSNSFSSPSQSQGHTGPVTNSMISPEPIANMGAPSLASTTSKSPTICSVVPSASTPPQSSQYPYSSSRQDGTYDSSLATAQTDYYPSRAFDKVEANKPDWPEVAAGSPTGTAAAGSDSNTYSQPEFKDPIAYDDFAQLDVPNDPKVPPSGDVIAESAPYDKNDPDMFDSQKTEVLDETNPPPKASKKSRAKKGDDASRKERKQRAAKSNKSQSATAQSPSSIPQDQSSSLTVNDSGTINDLIEHSDVQCDEVGNTDRQIEVLPNNDSIASGSKAEGDNDKKSKKSRTRKSGDKPRRERKPKSVPKPQNTAENEPPLPSPDALQVVPNPDESVDDSLSLLATEPAVEVKPKRIRIRDSKGKKKLPKFALKFAKTKKRKRLGSSENEQSDLDKTPPPSPDEMESGVQKRRSARNTKKLKYNDDIELGFSESDDESQAAPRKKSNSANVSGDGANAEESVTVEEPTVFAAPVEDTMVVEKIMASRIGKRELEPEPGEVLPPDGTHIDIEEFYVKYKNMSYLHCDWRTAEELEKGDRRVAQKLKRYKQKRDSSNVFSFMDEELFDPQYCEVDRILAVNEVEELVPDSEDEDAEKATNNPDLPEPAENSTAAAGVDDDAIQMKESEGDTQSKQPASPAEPMEIDNLTNTEDINIDSTLESEKQESREAMSNSEDAPALSTIDGEDKITASGLSSNTNNEKADTNIEESSPKEREPKMKKKISRHYLVKWRGLSYEESTWELEEHLDPEKIKQFERYKDVPPKSKWKPVKRPKPEEWVRKETSLVYKNNNTLREYQLEGINWLSFCWHQGRNCILADEMGLGKTIQSIAFINEIYSHGINGPFLIIVPLSTVGNWAREFETWTDLNVITYHGGSTSREMLKEYEMYYRNEQGNRITACYKFHVMITTFEIILSDCLELREIPWRCCIIDEAHRLKNRNCKLLEGLRLLNMEHRVLLTGTPLQNNVEELFSLLNFLEPAQFSSTEQFLLDFGDLKTEAQVDKLKLILKPMMLRRLKEDVEKTLAPKEETIVEVELTNIQKKYYRAILERNFSFLSKGTSSNNMPNLMNTMMELRKCCIHPYLINGAEEQILYEAKQTRLAGGEPMSSHQAMVNASGKLVLIDKLLPRLRADGHRVLIFSQMVRCLDILEDYVTHKHYPYERIDGRVRGGDRQQAIDRFSKPGSDRFVFLLCTRAGGLGINLTAADTVIIFDSDWNPQNDLQAQARCHRIGQSKAVKIYRLICRNTYEREMFDKASLKLGLDKAVLQSMNTQKAAGGVDGQLTKKEIEELLRKGAYGALMDDDNAGDKFCEEDIDQILQRRTQVITIESSEAKGSTFSKATFSSSNNREDIELDDPNFWEKWAKKANIDTDDILSKEELIQLAPRRRTQTKRYGADGSLIDVSDLDSSEEDEETISMRTRTRRGQPKSGPLSASKRKRSRLFDYDDEDFTGAIDGGYWSKSDCLKIETGLLTYGWGRWDEIIANNRFKKDISTADCESICRVILLYCLNSYKGDEKIKSFVWDLITPPEEASKLESDSDTNVSTRGRKPKFAPPLIRKTVADEISDANWPKEAKNDPLIALPDDQYRRHLQRNCNRLLIRVKCLHYLKYEILKCQTDKILADCHVNEVKLLPVPVDGELPVSWWDDEADKSLLVGIFKHGHDKFNLMRQDPNLIFLQRCGPPANEELMPDLVDDLDFDKSGLNLRTSESGIILDELLNDVVQSVSNAPDLDDIGVVDENKNSILKGNDINDSAMDSIYENGVAGSSQTTRMDVTDDESIMNESSIDATIPETVGNVNRESMDLKDAELGEFLLFPSATDFNQRFRRLITAYQKNSKKLEIRLAQQARDELKKERTSKFEAARNEREERKRSLAQKWSRREESDFVKAISFFGVEYDPRTDRYEWNKFRSIGKLEKKLDETLDEYFKGFVVMCKRVTQRPLTSDEENCNTSVEAITEDRAAKCLSRLEFFSKIREQTLTHPKLDSRLKHCVAQTDLPDWWENGKHDKDLLKAVAKHGLYRLDYNLAHDQALSFHQIIRSRLEQLFANPPASILIPLERLQELLDKNGIQYSKDLEHDNQSDDVSLILKSLLDNIEEELGDSTSSGQHILRQKTIRSSTGLTNLSSRPLPNILTRRSASTAIKASESFSSQSLNLSTMPDSMNEARKVAEITPILPDKIPNNLKTTHEAGEVSVTILTESALLKLDDKPPIVLSGASNPVTIKIRWPKDKAIQTRLENLIYLVEKNEWPAPPKLSVPTITLPNHLTLPATSSASSSVSVAVPLKNSGSIPSPKGDKMEIPGSPGSDISNLSSRASRQEDSKEYPNDSFGSRSRRKGRRPKQPDSEMSQLDREPHREDRQAAAKLRNLLSQGSSSTGGSSAGADKLTTRFGADKQGAGLSSLLASFKQKRAESNAPSRGGEKNPLDQSNPLGANLIPQILANLDPNAASLLLNSLNSITGGGGVASNLRSNIAPQQPRDNMFESQRASSRSSRSERLASKFRNDTQGPGLASLLSSFKPKRSESGSSSHGRDDKNMLDQNLASANLLPQIFANMKPEFRDLLASPDAASLLLNSLGNFTGTGALGANLRSGSVAQMSVENLLNPARGTSKGPPPAHQRSDNVPTAHGNTSGRELRKSSQNNREQSPSSIAMRSTRGKSSMPNLESLGSQKGNGSNSAKLSSGKKRGRPSSSSNSSPPPIGPPATDVLDLSSLPLSHKGNSLLRSEARSRRSKDQDDDEQSALPRSSTSLTKSNSKGSSKTQSSELNESHEQEMAKERGGRTTRASKRIGSRIDALALNLQAKRLHRPDSPEASPPSTREKSHDNQTAAHGSGKLSGDHKAHSVKAPPAAHSGSQKHNSGSSSNHHRQRDKTQPLPQSSSSTSSTSTVPTQSNTSNSRPQDSLAQLMSKVAQTLPTTSVPSSLSGQSSSTNARQDPMAQMMSNSASLLAGLNPSSLGGAGDLMGQLLRKAGSNDIVKNLLNEFVKNPSLALDPNILATLTASMPMGTQSLPTFNLPTSAATSLPYGNYANPLANPFLPFGMANLGMNNPLSNPLGLFPNLYMPPRFPTVPDQQQQQRQPSNQGGGTSDGGTKDKKMRYPRK